MKECKILPVVMATEHITIGLDLVGRLPRDQQVRGT